MAEQVTVNVEKVDVKTLNRKDGKGTFEVIEVTGGGKTYKGFLNNVQDVPSMGDVVNVNFEPVKNGKYTNNNIISMSKNKAVKTSTTVTEVSDDGFYKYNESPPAQTDKPHHQINSELFVNKHKSTESKDSCVDEVIKSFDPKNVATIHIESHVSKVSKDTSMEVSGILQALISTGHYVQVTERGTFLADKLLDTHLRLALNLKRAVAQDLEQNGSV